VLSGVLLLLVARQTGQLLLLLLLVVGWGPAMTSWRCSHLKGRP
jgi:hypothetical protein